MKDEPYNVDLSAIWKELGIELDGAQVRFNDSAPLAKTREAITYGAALTGSQPARPFAAVAGRTPRTSRPL
jgi:hypothetical protein